jgi:recombination protein RecA
MAAAALDTLLAQLGTHVSHAEDLASFAREPLPLSFGWADLDGALPDGGLPRGVIELASPRALGGATSVALYAIRAAQRADARAWCAWIDPEGTLHAPGLAAGGVDLARLLVVRPKRQDLARVAVKVASARALDVIVVDMDPIAGAPQVSAPAPPRPRARKPIEPEVLVRKLALLAEEGGARILLVTDRTAPRRAQWPVALRLELDRTERALTVRVAKDRRGRVGLKKTMPLPPRAPRAEEVA